MPELAEMETPKTAGFVDRGYNHAKRKQRMEDEAKEIAKLEAEARGESPVDEAEEVDDGGKSFNLRATLSTTDEALSPVIDMSRLSVHTIQNIINSDSAVTAEEVVSGGPEISKYITKKIDLNEQADVATVFMSILKPGNASVNLYYRFTTGDEDISQVAWDYAAPNDSIPTSSTRFSEVRWDINPTDLIGSIQFKIVMKSTITSQPPIIKDFRAICST